MDSEKRRLQWLSALTTSTLIIILGAASGYVASGRLQETMERQIAEDSRVISENLRIIINQVTREMTDQGLALDQVQDVLQSAQTHGWRGFACVVDKNGTVVAHPDPDMRGATVSLETYAPTELAGPAPVNVIELAQSSEPGAPSIYKSSSDIIAVQWLPDLMTYLCVHQPQDEIRTRVQALISILTRIGAPFVLIAAAGTWFFVGSLVERYQASLEVSEASNRSLVENSEAIVVIDTGNRVLHANPAAASLLGLGDDDISRQIDLLTGNTLLSELIADARAGKPPREIETDLPTAGQRIIPVVVRACSIDYHDQEAIYLLIRDVTETRRAREEILAANRKLKELDRLKSDFLNTVSHELRTPLTSIKWSTESLAGLNKNWDEGTFTRLLKIIREDNRRLSNLIEQLLSFSRLDAGQLNPRFEQVDLKELAEKAILELSPIAEAQDIQVALNAEPAAASVDREQIRLLLTNLLDNAIKYSPAGGCVTIDLTQQTDTCTISITDTGIGIKADDLDSIFHRFFRSDTPQVRDESGTGLGLAIVKGIVDAHDGSVLVRSALGEGSTFTVTLPLVRREQPESS